MKFATRLKVTASALSSTTLAAGVVVTMGTAATASRTLAQAIADGAAASDATAIQVGDTSVPFVFDDGTNWLEAYCTITSTTQITITQIISGSNGTGSVVFSGALPTVYNVIPGKWLRTVTTSADGVNVTDLTAITPTGTTYDSYLIPLFDPATNTAFKATVGALKTLFGTPAATVTSVTVSPSTVSLAGAGTQTFTATVTGTNSPAQTVTWTASAGTINSSTGAYTAPAATASTQTITITATSTVDNTKSGTATVTVAATGSTVSGVTISPTSASLTGGGTQTFTATVAGTNSPSQSVTWAVSTGGGSITSGGVYTAPAATASTQNIVVTATSVQDNTKSATVAITVAAATVTSVAVSPSAPSVTGGTTQQFTAAVTGTNNPPTTVTWSTTAGSINSSGLFTAPASTASAQTVTVTATSTLDGTKTGTATVTVPATVATMASTYKLTNTNSASMVASTTAATLSSPDYYGSPTSSIRVNIRDSSGNTVNPANVKLVFGLFSDSTCPVSTFATTGLPVGANGTQNSGGHSNGLVGVQALGGWTYNGAQTQSNYGTVTPSASMFAWFGTAAPVGAVTSGQVIDMKLWVVYSDNSAKAHDNDTGTPIKFSFTVP